ncbi:hypothetical protein MTO96_043523 [Rhipicephalus appendiculatus]
MGFGIHDLLSIISKISAYGLFDPVQRWILEGPLISRNHAGLMAVEETKLNADALINVAGSEAPPRPCDWCCAQHDRPPAVPLLVPPWATDSTTSPKVRHGLMFT